MEKSGYKFKRVLLLLMLIFLQIIVISCKKNEEKPITKTVFALDTVVDITIFDSNRAPNYEDILNGAVNLIDKYENIYSRTLETSELYQLNNRRLKSLEGPSYRTELSDELSEIINYGLKYSKLSKGKFDITVEPLSSIWDFKAEDPKLPEESLIADGVSKIGYDKIQLDGNIITLDEDTRIDLGAIAKGYIADKTKEYLVSKGVESAIINLGGNVLCLGEKAKDQPFKIGIQKPFAGRNEVIGTMDIKDKSVVTSGVYERYFNISDKMYHHILNPKTGYPYENNLIAVTIISPKSVDGDGLSTSCFPLGLEEGMEVINNIEDIHAIFITEDYEFHYSDGFFEDIKVIEVKGE